MKRIHRIFMVVGFVGAILLAVFLLAGCGDSTTSSSTTAAIQCSADTASIIPPPSGKPQYVLFYRDT